MSDVPAGYDDFAAAEIPVQEAQPVSASRDVATSTITPKGYDDFIAPEMREEKYGTGAEMAKTFAEGVAKGVAGPLATGLESMLLGNQKEMLARQETNPVTHGAGELTGLVGGSLVAPEVTLGGALSKAGAVAEVAGLGKLGTSVLRGSIENLVYQAGDEASKMLLQDPGQSADTAIASMGLATLVGGGFGTIPPLWHAVMGKKTGGVLGAIADKFGGIEGAEVAPGADALAKSGLDIKPELYGLVSKEPAVQEMARTLSQSDSSKAGRSFQEAYKEMTHQAGDKLVGALGKSAKEVSAMPEVSAYETGKKLATTLADEYEAKISPFSKGFDEVKASLHGVELEASVADKLESALANQADLQAKLDKATKAAIKAQKAGSPEASIEAAAKVQEISDAMKAAKKAAEVPGTADTILDKISQKAIEEGWVTSPSSDIMREVNRVVKELPLQKNLKNLSDFITQVGHNTNKDPMNGPLRRAGGIMSSIMREVEGEVMAKKIGSEAGPDAVEHLRALQEGYRVQSALKDGIADRLGAKGASTSGYAGAIRDMASTDAEGVLRKLSGKNDADWLDFVQKHYPNTAEVLRDYHRSELIAHAANKAKDGAVISNDAFLNKLKGMPKELRDFAVNPESQQSILAIGAALDAFKNPNYNFSNSARVGASLLKDWGPTALTGATALMGHGLPAAALMGFLGKTLGKEAPDAVRLSLLRFLSSGERIDAGAFKTMFDYIRHTVKGETLLSNATKNIFKAGTEVIPAHLMPKESEKAKLDRSVSSMRDNPEKAIDMVGKTGHYLPAHATTLGQTGAAAMQYLNSIRPNTDKMAPLDTQRNRSPSESAQYNRALGMVQQPLMIFKHIADGTLTPADVLVVKSVYPSLYDRSVQKLTDNMTTAVSKGQQIPYKTKLGLGLYMGQALDSTMKPASIVAAQPQAAQMPPQGSPPPQKSIAPLNKMSKMYKTQAQSAEQDRINRK